MKMHRPGRKEKDNRRQTHLYDAAEAEKLFVVKNPQRKIREAVGRIVERFNPIKIILFGSRARNRARADSDTDLLIIMPVRGSRRKTATEIDMALFGIRIPLDLIVVTPEDVQKCQNRPGTLIYTALKEGKVVHERAAS
jgi:predicted nucleotidyltransferase